MSKKSDFIAKLMKEVVPRWPIPTEPRAGATLLEQGIVLVLMRYMTQAQAESTLAALSAAYEDWNEARVSQVQELAAHIRTGSRKKGVELLNQNRTAAIAVKDYLQDVFQQTHGLDLEFLRDGSTAVSKGYPELISLGQPGLAYLMWVAEGGELPVTGPLVKLLDRLDLIKRTASTKRAREYILPLVPKGQTLQFAMALYEVSELWGDSDEPVYETYAVLRECPAGKKAYKDRMALLKRQEIQRKKSEQRRIAQEKKEQERLRREEERERKRAVAEAKRQARELEKRQRMAAKKRADEARKREAEKKKLAAKKKEEARRAAAAKKKAAAKKESGGKKAAAAKKGTSKKRTTKKKASKAAKTTGAKASARTTSKKKKKKKKTATKKSSASRSTKKKARRR